MKFPVKEIKLTQPIPASSEDHQLPEADTESDSLGPSKAPTVYYMFTPQGSIKWIQLDKLFN